MRSSVGIFPEAPGANGHPPSPHKELSNLKIPNSNTAITLASPKPLVS